MRKSSAYHSVLSTIQKHNFCPSITSLMECMGSYYSQPTVAKAVAQLERDGFISTRCVGPAIQIMSWPL